jgi:hypothetical protein
MNSAGSSVLPIRNWNEILISLKSYDYCEGNERNWALREEEAGKAECAGPAIDHEILQDLCVYWNQTVGEGCKTCCLFTI